MEECWRHTWQTYTWTAGCEYTKGEDTGGSNIECRKLRIVGMLEKRPAHYLEQLHFTSNRKRTRLCLLTACSGLLSWTEESDVSEACLTDLVA